MTPLRYLCQRTDRFVVTEMADEPSPCGHLGPYSQEEDDGLIHPAAVDRRQSLAVMNRTRGRR